MTQPIVNDRRPLVAHVIQCLAVGGLENGLVNLINHMPEKRYRHAIICLATFSEYARRIRKENVPVIALHQRPGQDLSVHWRLLKLFIRLKPAIVHTRNLSGLEFQTVAALAGVPGRVHGEHGRDMHDLNGNKVKYKLLRKGIRPLVHQYTAVSVDLAQWLVRTIGVKPRRLTQIYNGVDGSMFKPSCYGRESIGPAGFCDRNSFVVGTVGRMQAVKDQLTLIRAFLRAIEGQRALRERLRLVVIGDGPLRGQSRELLDAKGVGAIAWLPGERTDIPRLLRGFDLFVLPSIAEGISNTILEAMASGLPVIATNVGGNSELVVDSETGMLVPPSDPPNMAHAIRSYLSDPAKLARHGKAGRKRVEEKFSMDKMVEGYLSVYDEVLARRAGSIRRIERRLTSTAEEPGPTAG
jgi:sugar transferase (PEP-CTERM/EpsH1 system associated)